MTRCVGTISSLTLAAFLLCSTFAEAQQSGSATPPSPSSTASKPDDGAVTPQSDTNKPPQTPVGVAAAPAIVPSGVTASTPSGAAIAPGKQNRVHIFSVKTALIVGAVVALGVVAAATLGSPSSAH